MDQLFRILCAAFAGSYRVDGGPWITGDFEGTLCSAVVHRIDIYGAPTSAIDFKFDDAGVVTVHANTRSVASRAPSTLDFLTVAVHIDPQDYGAAAVPGGDAAVPGKWLMPVLGPDWLKRPFQGPHAVQLLCGMSYDVYLGGQIAYGNFTFRLDAQGAVASVEPATSAAAVQGGLRFSLVDVAIDPRQYVGSYYVSCTHMIARTTGRRTFRIPPGHRYFVAVGGYSAQGRGSAGRTSEFYFRVHPTTGFVNVEDRRCADGDIGTLAFRLVQFHVDPGTYRHGYRLTIDAPGAALWTGPACFHVVPGTCCWLRASAEGEIYFAVGSDQTVWTYTHGAAGRRGVLQLETRRVRIRPSGVAPYRIGADATLIVGATDVDLALGLTHTVTVPGIGQGRVAISKEGPSPVALTVGTVTFDIDYAPT